MQKVVNIIFTIFVLCLLIYSTVCTRKLNENRRLCDSYRERCIETERVCDELRNEFGRVRDITGRLNETADRTITNARDVAETVEILRSQIKELENICGRDTQCEYYQYWDSYFDLE